MAEPRLQAKHVYQDKLAQFNYDKKLFAKLRALRKQLADLQNQIAAAQQQGTNLEVALGFRENALRESIQVVEEPEAEVVN